MRTENENLRSALQEKQVENLIFKGVFILVQWLLQSLADNAEMWEVKLNLDKLTQRVWFVQEENEERETERTKLVIEMDQIKEQNEKLKHTLQLQLKENDRLKVCPHFSVNSKLLYERESLTLILPPGGECDPSTERFWAGEADSKPRVVESKRGQRI